jgi:hypothetical protein
LRRGEVEASPPGKNERGGGAANGFGLGGDRLRSLLELVFEALLHELDILGDRLVEFVDLLAAEDAALLIVRGNAKR